MDDESKCRDGGGYFIYGSKKCKCCTNGNALTNLKTMSGYTMYVKSGGGFAQQPTEETPTEQQVEENSS